MNNSNIIKLLRIIVFGNLINLLHIFIFILSKNELMRKVEGNEKGIYV